jgi:mycothiol synthase
MIVRSAIPSDRDGLESVFRAVETTTGREPISEHKAIRVLSGDSIEIVAIEGTMTVGYAQAAWHGGGDDPHWAIEVVAGSGAPPGLWSAMLARVTAAVPSRRHRYLWVTRHAELAAAERAGWRVDRTLHEMHRPLPVDAPGPVPHGIAIRPFRRHEDEERWLAAHNEAFAGHPEVGGMTRSELELRLEQPWFDPGGLILAWRGGRVVGSCWTKQHGGDVGEIYLIGLRPEAQGIGLGRALVIAGLADLHLRQRADEGMLWVDEANRGAHALYVELGFATKTTIYRLTPSG